MIKLELDIEDNIPRALYDATIPLLDKSKLGEWIERVAESYNKSVGRINYRFVNDEEILKINREFINHDYYTDIITFDYSNDKRIAGDIVISVETVATNAELNNVGYSEELKRVFVHGVLHLIGINDKGPGEREIMEKAEDAALLVF